MTKERLQNLSLEALQEIASRVEISFYQNIDRETLVEHILDAQEEDKSERENSNNAAMRVKEKKFVIVKDDEEKSEGPDEFPLSESYNETKITLLLRDPLWAFAYWDFKFADVEKIQSNPGSNLYIRVFQVDSENIRKKHANGPFEIPVKLTDRKWYINLPTTGVRYSAVLIVRYRQKERVLCSSNTIDSPKISIDPTNNTSADKSFYSILAVSGLQDSNDFSEKGGIPQRIISLLDTQYLHLQG
jgi:hypothetical protein